MARGTVFNELDRAWNDDPAVRQQPRAWQPHAALEGLSPDDLVVRNRSRNCHAEVKNAALATLVQLAKDDDLAARTVLQILTPAAKALLARIGDIPGGAEERAILVVEVLWELIRFYPCHRPGSIAGNLMCDLLRRVLAERPRVATVSLDSLGDNDAYLEDPARHASPAEELLELLADAVAAGYISRAGARLIIRLRVEGVPAAQLIGDIDVDDTRPRRFGSEQTVRQARQRAERRLMAAMATTAA